MWSLCRQALPQVDVPVRARAAPAPAPAPELRVFALSSGQAPAVAGELGLAAVTPEAAASLGRAGGPFTDDTLRAMAPDLREVLVQALTQHSDAVGE